MKNKVKLLALGGAALLCGVALRQKLTVKRYRLSTDKLSSKVRVLVVSDLHSTVYGRDQQELLKEIKKLKPDLILLPGDIIDDKLHTDGAKQLLAGIGGRYPCYYVCGNHEARFKNLKAVKNLVSSYGVTVLEGSGEVVDVGSQLIRICGVDDPECFASLHRKPYNAPGGWIGQLKRCDEDAGDDIFSILLSHRPELAGNYMNTSFDLVTAGHAHGGQVRVPFLVNGLYAPNQGVFPEYAGGEYYLDGTTMIVSRGLAKSRLPRVFNPLELVVIDLFPQKNSQ